MIYLIHQSHCTEFPPLLWHCWLGNRSNCRTCFQWSPVQTFLWDLVQPWVTECVWGSLIHRMINMCRRMMLILVDLIYVLLVMGMFAIAHIRLTALFPGLPRWAGTRKVEPIWILLKQETVSGCGISWARCKSAPSSRQITTPASHHSVFYRPDALPATQPTASKHWRELMFAIAIIALYHTSSCYKF